MKTEYWVVLWDFSKLEWVVKTISIDGRYITEVGRYWRESKQEAIQAWIDMKRAQIKEHQKLISEAETSIVQVTSLLEERR